MGIKNILFILLVVVLAFALSFFYEEFLSHIPDSRIYSEISDKIKLINNKISIQYGENQTIRYIIYTDTETIFKNNLTKSYLSRKSAEDYTIKNINELRRFKNKTYIYEEDFKDKLINFKDNYFLIKVIENNNLSHKAYLSYDPTIKKYSKFWYNGEILTSVRSLHTFDALTGKGISNEKILIPVLVDKEIIAKYE